MIITDSIDRLIDLYSSLNLNKTDDEDDFGISEYVDNLISDNFDCLYLSEFLTIAYYNHDILKNKINREVLSKLIPYHKQAFFLLKNQILYKIIMVDVDYKDFLSIRRTFELNIDKLPCYQYIKLDEDYTLDKYFNVLISNSCMVSLDKKNLIICFSKNLSY